MLIFRWPYVKISLLNWKKQGQAAPSGGRAGRRAGGRRCLPLLFSALHRNLHTWQFPMQNLPWADFGQINLPFAPNQLTLWVNLVLGVPLHVALRRTMYVIMYGTMSHHSISYKIMLINTLGELISLDPWPHQLTLSTSLNFDSFWF